MSRLELKDSPMDMMMKMAGGNPGAIGALTDIAENHDRIDPQAAMGWLGAILILDTFQIYGSSIYVLYSDKCGRDVRKMLMLMRATQLGFMSNVKLKEMADDQMRSIDLTVEEYADLDNKVCAQLEQFEKPS